MRSTWRRSSAISRAAFPAFAARSPSSSSRAASRTRPTSSSRRRRIYVHAHQARPGGQAAAVGARRRTRVPRHECAAREPASRCREMRAVRGRGRDRPRLLRDGVRARAGCCGTSRCPAFDAPERGAHLRRAEPRDRRSCTRSTAGRRPGRLRQARQLLRAPDRPLDQAVPGLRSPSRSRRWTG